MRVLKRLSSWRSNTCRMATANPSEPTSVTAPSTHDTATVPAAAATPMSRRPRVLRLGAIAVSAAAAIGVGWWFLPARVTVANVERRDFVQTVVATGHVEAPHRVTIAAQVVGAVTGVPVAEGQTVAAGDPLVLLDARELHAAADQAEMNRERERHARKQNR